jgi:hypothetical protein
MDTSLFILYLQLALQIDQGCVEYTHRRLGHHGVLLVARQDCLVAVPLGVPLREQLQHDVSRSLK